MEAVKKPGYGMQDKDERMKKSKRTNRSRNRKGQVVMEGC
jgi:hypothetical protein